MRVALICKGRLFDSNTSWAQGGVAICTAANASDSPEQHLQDTLSAGAGLCDEHMVRLIVNGGQQLYEKLERFGLMFDRQENGNLALAREGGHCQARVLHSKDASGRAIAETLVSAVRRSKNIAVFEEMFAVDLLTQFGRCVGLRVLRDEQLLEILAPRVVLASGGLGQIFSRTTNPNIATGDGIAMAYRAGAELVDMEFVQFHPTALNIPGAPASLISEAVRGDGAHLLDANNERFAFRFHKNGELATRDVVSRAILATMKEQNLSAVKLDMRPIGAANTLSKYPNIVQTCRNWGIDPLDSPVPVSPAAHYFMGGIWTDQNGRSSLPGLYAIGECACTGLHGANRLASNSLLEGGVMALRAAKAILGESSRRFLIAGREFEGARIFAPSNALRNLERFKNRMFRELGICRNGDELEQFIISESDFPVKRMPMDQRHIEAANIHLLGTLIGSSALARCESRGSHYRSDYPHLDNARFNSRYFVSRQERHFSALGSAVKLSSPTHHLRLPAHQSGL
jgi:L-aspartate oxidase